MRCPQSACAALGQGAVGTKPRHPSAPQSRLWTDVETNVCGKRLQTPHGPGARSWLGARTGLEVSDLHGSRRGGRVVRAPRSALNVFVRKR